MSTAIAPPDASSQNCAAMAESLLVQYQRDQEAPSNQADRRRSPRHEFDCWQMVAEYEGEKLPSQQDFRLFRFYDISAGGISFLAEERPLGDDLVIALGNIPFVFFHVRIVRTARCKDLGEGTLQIGCQFVKRIPG